MVSNAVCYSKGRDRWISGTSRPAWLAWLRVQDSQPRLHRETLSKNKNNKDLRKKKAIQWRERRT